MILECMDIAKVRLQIIDVKVNAHGDAKFVLRDGPSGTGTFYMNELVGVKERVNMEESAIITIGATTLLFTTTAPTDDVE